MDPDHLEKLAQIAEMYYLSKLTQQQIAARTGYSRSMISRLLTEAQQESVVEITINHPQQRNIELEHQLIAMLDLKTARILKHSPSSYTEALQMVGSLAARYLSSLLNNDLVIGISWGTAIYETVKSLGWHPYQGIKVVQMLGSLGTPNPEIDGPELMWRLAEKVSARYSAFPVPLFVDSETTREALLNTPNPREVLDSFRTIELALVGIGTVNPTQASLLRTGYISSQQLDSVRQAGAVGDVCVIHYDLNGNAVETPITRRFLGIDRATFLRIPVKIGVAAGPLKAPAILGACRAGLVNVLITDEFAANAILNLISEEEENHDRE